MSVFTVRDLLTRITIMRPDLDEGLCERLAQEAAKRIFRDSFLGIVMSPVYPLFNTNHNAIDSVLLTSALPVWGTDAPFYTTTINQSTFAFGTGWQGSYADALSGVNAKPTAVTPAEVLRVMQVCTVTLPIFATAQFGGYQSTVDYLPDPSSVDAGVFYIVSEDGVTYNELVGKPGDIFQSTGSDYTLTYLENYDTLQQVNYPGQNLYINRPKSSFAASITSSNATQQNVTQAINWSQRSGQMMIPGHTGTGDIGDPVVPNFTNYSGTIVDLYPAQGYPTAIYFLYAATPIGEMGDVVLNLPDEARDAIVHLALADWLEVPGKNQNLILSENHRQEYERLRGGLRSMAALGMGGSPQWRSPLFGGRGNRYFPFFYNPTLMPGPN